MAAFPLRFVILAVVLLIPTPVRTAQPDHPDIQRWLRLLQQHRAGASDQSVADASRWTWSRLGPVLGKIQQHGLPPVVLRTAALLTDIAVHVPLDERPSGSEDGFAIIAEDGERRGMGALDPHLAAARRLLDAVGSDPSQPQLRAEVIAWYRAVSAMLASRHNLADWKPHIVRSLNRFPDDPGLLFDAGCFHETFGSPVMQAAMRGPAAPSSEKASAALLRQSQTSSATLLAEAEKYFKHAAERDPRLGEAHVRRGRLLRLRGRATEATGELEQALRLELTDTVKYYAHLFLGEVLAEAGQTDQALSSFEAAAALFPDAQSPHLSISQLAMDQRDTARSRASIDKVLAAERASEKAFDPWWVYNRGSGRDVEIIYPAFTRRIEQLPAIDLTNWRKR